jgi:tetraacyldisaccharide 4'-kinase
MSWGNPEGFSERLQAELLKPLSWFYGLGNEMHRLWHQSVLKPAKLSVPVISVGNITCGGTGKTPVVISLSQYLSGIGLKVCVVSRGYRKQGQQALTIVCDGQGNFADCRESGDEPLLIAQSVPNVVVIVGANRLQACNKAIEQFGCDIILLDDGFQHYRLDRELDIVLLDYADDLANDSLLPAGRLREPLNQLKRAGHIVITKLPPKYDHARLRRIKATAVNIAPHASVNTCRFISRGLTAIPFGPIAPFRSIKNHTVVAFCGLARPESFFSMLKEEGLNVVAQKSFPDHHWYEARDLEALRQLKKTNNATLLITTQKDAVKLLALGNTDDILALVIDTEWMEGIPASVKNAVVSLQKTSFPGVAKTRMQASARI